MLDRLALREGMMVLPRGKTSDRSRPAPASQRADSPRPRAVASRSLSWRLSVATLKVILPLIAATLIMFGWIANGERQAREALLVGDAHSLGDSVSLQVDKYFVLAKTLSRSSWLQRADLTGFEQEARAVLSDMPEVTLLLSGEDGRPLVSVPKIADDSPLWRERASLAKQSLALGSAYLSDVSADAVALPAHASVETRVSSGGGPTYELALVLSLDQFADLLERQKLPKGWLSGIIDRNGAFVARLPRGGARPGTPASQDFRNAAQRESRALVQHDSRDGEKILSAYAPAINGWTVGVAAGANQFAVGANAFLLMAAVAAAALTASVILSLLSGRRLAGQIRALQTKAEQVFAGAPIAPTPTGVSEFDELTEALARASRLLSQRGDQQRRAEDDLRKSEEHFRLLAESVPQLVWTAGSDGRIEYTNGRRDQYGWGALKQADWSNLIHPEDRRATASAWLQASEAGLPYQMEHRLLASDKGYAWHLSRAMPLLDARGKVVRWYGTTTDIHDQKLREENVRFLMREVNHRSRNLLAVALAIARRTVTTTMTARQFEEKYSERLLGLLASQDLLIGRNWQGVPLEALVQAQVSLPAKERERRFVVGGPSVLLGSTAAQTLGLALRELFNNAVSYGAFANDCGRVDVRWRIDESGAEPMLDVTWRERGGPPVAAGSVRGFGSVLIEGMVAEGLDASAILIFDVEGVRWRLKAPLREIATGDSPSGLPSPA